MNKVNNEDHRLYSIWRSMKTRCNNPNCLSYKYYGKRGIKVCKSWSNSFWAFVEDMYPSFKEGLTLDRIDNDGDYTPDNCRWATKEEQANNQNKNYTKIFYDGQYYTESELSKLTGIPRTTVQARRNKGYSDKEIVYGRQLRKYEVDGKLYNLKELAKLLNTSSQNLSQHFKRGKTLMEVLNDFR